MQVIELQAVDFDDAFANGVSSPDTFFRNIQKKVTNFLIWKVENMQLVAIPKDQHGIFYTSDSYLIYAASCCGSPAGIDTVVREIRNGPLEYHLHFWLGSETTSEKSGVAAYKTVELDKRLGGITVQHRETQANESARFRSYFKNGIRILKKEMGNLPSTPMLYKIKGKKIPIIVQEEGVSWKFFNSDDVILILTKNTIFSWIGRASNSVERQLAAKIALSLKEENNVPTITFVNDGYEKTLSEDAKAEFDNYLPLDKRIVLPPDYNADVENGQETKTPLRLYRCTEMSGKYRVVEVKPGPISQSDLNNEDVYIVDNSCNGIWVWVGKGTTEKERLEAIRNARGFVKKKNYPNNTQVVRVIDGHEPVEFKMLFSNWTNKDEVKNQRIPAVICVSKVAVGKFDAETLVERPALAAESQLIDDGFGTIKMWKITKSNTVELPSNRQGTMFSGECYLILYTYEMKTLRNVVYVWLGNDAPQEDINCTKFKANEISGELDEGAMQVRIVQGFESPHFLQLFHGRMIVFRGRSPAVEDDHTKKGKSYLLQICGSTSYSTKALEVAAQASSLNSNYCYVFKKRKHYYIWCGNFSTGDQREMAKGFIGKDFSILMEGKESANFWDDLGGQSPYHTSKLSNDDENLRVPRLFNCRIVNGRFKAEECVNFTQNDLLPEDVLLLDTWKSVFMWMGSLSSNAEQKSAMTTAEVYLANDPAGRSMNMPIALIKQGQEPPNFAGFFANWNSSLWTNYKSFEEVRYEIEGSSATIPLKDVRGNGECNHFDQYIKYPIKVLAAANDCLPGRVDPLRKEVHLTHDDFVSLFKIDYSEFETLPKWRQQEMKKKVGLF
ncbi:hypothetical protein PPYR_09546 [Photinus pyralis]|uniref:HP domain-containing protein n=1 Tax=Photinus pyralis TaxID=7054 RepID=A0A5N4AMQ8_PHOPY|nr:advillin [Photinus pyralis]KAB0798553.1 hypothetical protein PPYR_09546 [Photinus pyralis]